MVYVPKVFVPGQQQQQPNNNQQQQQQQQQSTPSQQFAASAPPTVPHLLQQTQQYQPSQPAFYQHPPATAPPAEFNASYASAQLSAPPHHQTQQEEVPSFSQALDVLPPTLHSARPTPVAASSVPPTILQGTAVPARTSKPYSSSVPSAPYGQTTYAQQPLSASYPMAAAETIAGQNVTSSSINSSIYSGGPTNGLVSEGNPTHCQKVDYEIKGHEMQLVEIELDPDETVIAEAGAMMYMDDGIEFKTKFGDGSTPNQGFFKKLMAAGGRILTGESLFFTHFKNKGDGPSIKARVAFAAPYPGSILPINMANIGGRLICQKDAFLCAAKGTKLALHFNKRIGSGLFGGEGFILQKMTGDGMAFIHAGGTIIKRELQGERLRVDTGCLVAFTDGIKFDIQLAPGLKTMFFGGEGIFLATLQGHGTVWIQSLPFSRLADRVVQAAPSIGGQRQGEGSSLTGGIGDMIGGEAFSSLGMPGF